MSYLLTEIDQFVVRLVGPPWEDAIVFQYVCWGSLAWLFVGWVVAMIRRNAGIVRLAWATDLLAIALLYLIAGGGSFPRRLVLCSMIIYSASYYTLLAIPTLWGPEANQWVLRRKKWQSGKSFFHLRSPILNFLFLFEGHAVLNIFVFSFPLGLVCQNKTVQFSYFELVAVILWILTVYFQNVARVQLAKFHASGDTDKKILNTGVWKISRHPNHLFEFLTWCTYVIFSAGSVQDSVDYYSLSVLPFFAWIFVKYFTGLRMVDADYMERYGKDYEDYMKSTGMLIPRISIPRRRNKSTVN